MARAPTKNEKINAKGKVVRKNAAAVKAGKKAAHKLKGKPKSAAHRLAISKALKRSYATGKTSKTGPNKGRKRLAPGRGNTGVTYDKVKKLVAARKAKAGTKKKSAPKAAAKPAATKAKTAAKKTAPKAAAKPRGRPKGSTNKPKAAAPKAAAKPRGRPKGSTNKPKVAPAKAKGKGKGRSMG